MANKMLRRLKIHFSARPLTSSQGVAKLIMLALGAERSKIQNLRDLNIIYTSEPKLNFYNNGVDRVGAAQSPSSRLSRSNLLLLVLIM